MPRHQRQRQHIGAHLRRLGDGRTAAELGELAGCDARDVHRALSGGDVPVSVYQRLADVYGVPFGVAFGALLLGTGS